MSQTDKDKPKRSRDGCQNCKKGRIKCDRTKPVCKVCHRRKLECNYSKNWMFVSVENDDARHPSFKSVRRHSGSKNRDVGSDTGSSNQDKINLSENNEIVIELPQIPTTNSASVPTDSLSPFSPAITEILKSGLNQHIFRHYLQVTCGSLDPVNGAGSRNISQRFFVPVASMDPATFHGILCISATQMTFTNQEISKYAVLNKSLSYRALHNLVSRPETAYSLEALSAIICHLSIEITQSGIHNWPTHIRACRSIINERRRRGLPVDQLAWFLYVRIARYDNFASLTTGDPPLFDEHDVEPNPSYDPILRDLNCLYGSPPGILFFASKLSCIGRAMWWDGPKLEEEARAGLANSTAVAIPAGNILHARLARLGYDFDELSAKFTLLLKTHQQLGPVSDWECIECLWTNAMGIHYYRQMFDMGIHDPVIEQYRSHAVEAAALLPPGSLLCSSIVWPLLVVATVTTNSADRLFLQARIGEFFELTNIGSFQQLQGICNQLWHQLDLGRCATVAQLWQCQIEHGWTLLTA